MEQETMATESFSRYNKTYFFDFMQAVNGSCYIKISRSDWLPDDTFKKQEVVIFEEDFGCLLEAMSSLFRTAAYQETAKQCFSRSRATLVRGIKSWDPETRPREKMMEMGADAMLDAELLAMLIGSGSPRETAVALAGRILSGVDFNLARLAGSTLEELCVYQGMGHAKSLTILAALELAKRLMEQQLNHAIPK
jgi:DNA repair protein RadC